MDRVSAPPDTRQRPHRRIGLHHIAFLRGYFEGLDLAVLAEQYLDFGRDRQRAQTARRWIVDELVAAARKRHDGAGARLLKLPAGALPSSLSAEPTLTLEAFRQEVDPDGVYSESELVELFQDLAQPDSGADRRAARNARLRSRQRALLDQLEASLAEPPRLSHRAADWLEPSIAARLEQVGLYTLADLMSYVNKYGYRWYKRVPRVGALSARRIVQWVERNAEGLGASLKDETRLPRSRWPAALHSKHRQRRTGIAPIEYFDHPDRSVQADRDALLQCLEPYRVRPASFRAYRIQAERVLLWSVHIRKIGLAEWRPGDVDAFMAFAATPSPAEQWTGTKAERGTTEWRPFERSQSIQSLEIARRILKSLFNQLVKSKYIEQNPFAMSKKIQVSASHAGSGFDTTSTTASVANARAPTAMKQEAWVALLDHLDATPRSDPGALRMRVIVGVLAETGWRLATLLSTTLSALAPPTKLASEAATEANPTLTLSRTTQHAIDLYLLARGLDRHDRSQADLYLIGRHDALGLDAHRVSLTTNVIARAIGLYLKKLSALPEAQHLGLSEHLRWAGARTLQHLPKNLSTHR